MDDFEASKYLLISVFPLHVKALLHESEILREKPVYFLNNSIGNRNHIGVMQVKGIKLCNNNPFVHYGAAIV